MRRLLRAAVISACILALGSSAPAAAQSDMSADPATVALSTGGPKIIGDAHGFVLVSEKPTGHGSVIDTFKSATTTIRTIGWADDQLTFEPASPAEGTGGLAIGVVTNADKTGPKADRYQRSGRSPLVDLMDFGLSKDRAEQELKRESVLQNTPIALAGQSKLDGGDNLADIINPPSVYEYKCLDISAINGEYTGLGCSVIYRPVVNGGDWWLETHYWISIQIAKRNSCGLLDCYYHLQGVAWKIVWPSGNQIVDLTPKSTVTQDTCHPIDWSVGWKTDKGVQLGLTGHWDVCPTKTGPWYLTSLQSGAGWWGNEKTSNSFHSAEGAQIIHSPPAASAVWKQYYLIWYTDGCVPIIGC